MQFTYPIPQKFRADDDDAGVIHAYLESQGHVVQGVSINEIDRTITIEADADPLESLKAWNPPLSDREKARQALIALNATNLDTATVAELRTAMKQIRGLLNYSLKTP